MAETEEINERAKRIANILGTRGNGAGGGIVRAQATADETVERGLAEGMAAMLDVGLPHIK